jgi:hypothetical protein
VSAEGDPPEEASLEMAMSIKRKPYYDSADKPIMETSVIVLADILGFREMVKKARSDGTEQQQLDLLERILNPAHKAYLVDPSGAKWRMKTFSDNVIIGYPNLGVSQGAFEFSQACYNIVHFQRELTINNLFIRGGIAVGQVHIGDDLIFGGIIDELYQAEGKADVPRIVLLDSSIEYLRKHVNQERDSLLAPILLEDSGISFINYLYPLSVPVKGEERNQELLGHKDAISTGLANSKGQGGSDKIYKKYLWAAEYHNWFCSQTSRFNNPYYMVSI